jgi:hypothetical protein
MLKHKKVMSLALAAAMAASLSIPASASTAAKTEDTTNRSLSVDGAYQAVDIAVVVPTTGTVIINPYALPVEIGKDASNNAVKVKNQQIVTKPLTLKNQSDIDLDINVSATATVKGNLALATAAVTPADEKKNTAFLYLDVEASTLTGATSAVTEAAIAEAWDDITWTGYDASSVATNVLALTKSGTAATKEKMGTLAASDVNTDGSFKEYKNGSIAYVGLVGSVAQNPTTAWAAKDGVSVKIAFTFVPHVETQSSDDNEQQDNSNTVTPGADEGDD